MILPAEEHREDTNRLARLVDVEPVDRSSDGEMPHTEQDVVMALAPMWRGQDTLRAGTDLHHPRPGVIERVLHPLAEAEVAAQEMIE